MSVKTGAVGSSPKIDKLLEAGADSLKNYAATSMLRDIVVFIDTDVEEEYKEEYKDVYAAARCCRADVRRETVVISSELPDTGIYIKDLQDGNIVQRYKRAADEQQLQRQAASTLAFAEDYAFQRHGNGMSREEFFADYLSMSIEYLMEGALLTCSQATNETQTIRILNPVVAVNYSFEGNDGETENPLLNVSNPANNGIAKYATVSDTKREYNIIPFRNCILTHSGDGEEKVLKNKEGCMKYGTCYALMNLCDEWVNVQSGAEYGTPSDEKKNCINMLSHLGCYQGGMIFPLDSGQRGLEEKIKYIDTVDKDEIICEDRALTEDELKINARYIYNYFAYEGWSHNAICGMLGNMEWESGLSPGRWNGVVAFGLTQWNRPSKLFEWANPRNLNPYDIDTQLEKISSEVGEKYGQWNSESMSFYDYTQSYESVEYLAEVFLNCYEQPRDEEAFIDKRVEFAVKWSDFFMGITE